ncbi:MAG: hypothetical protein NZ895_01385 [Archaeoglobaceae archaeon]|nr:hypothetical protein [Archaeoglobaceae archaeon]MCX8151664.1 hypothetical protein [Archaeoglobaceae archaeon]MDW8013058.1 hypothetical protein [Archaeoglobaceae archaeon]
MRRLERRSARILAVLLVLVMLSSVFATAIPYIFPQRVEKRELVAEFKDFRELASRLNASYYIYFNYSYLEKLSDKDLLKLLIFNKTEEVLDPRIFNRLVIELPTGFNEVLIVFYRDEDYPVYFVANNGQRIFFAGTESRNVEGYQIKLYRSIALVDTIEPFALGFYPSIYKALSDLKERKKVIEHLDRINGSFAYAYFLVGEYALERVKSNNTSICDFFFEGYRYENGSYEKVWAINFVQNFFFVESEDYYVEMFEDGFGIAVVRDKDFEKLLEFQPEIRGIVIVTQ